MSAFGKQKKHKPHSKNELAVIPDKSRKHRRKKRPSLGDRLLSVPWIENIYYRLPVKVRRYLCNKYAVGSTFLLIAILIVILVSLIPQSEIEEKPEETVAVQENEIIYIIDENGNKVATSVTDDDSIIMQNQKEVEDPVLLSYNPDTRSGYMNNCIFLGDSRTVAMVSYGFISDSNALAKVGVSHWQVSSMTFEQNSGAKFTLSDYLRSHSESVIYVCYGVNGMNGMDEEKYKQTYTDLVDKIISLAGDRHVVLMSIWPVDDNGRYRGSVKNEWVNKYNAFLYNMAAEKGLYYLDVASILKDENGSMKKEYDSGDGLHYKASAYTDILDYIVHHPVPGVSDEGEFVVHYVKPRGEYKEIMTEEPTLPQNIQLEDGTFPFLIPTPVPETPEAVPTEEPTPTPTPTPEPEEQEEKEEEREKELEKEREEEREKEQEEERRREEEEELERRRREQEQ